MNSKYLEKLIQEEYQKIIQEQFNYDSETLELLKKLGAENVSGAYRIKLAANFVRDLNLIAKRDPYGEIEPAPRSAEVKVAKGDIVNIYPQNRATIYKARPDAAAEYNVDWEIITINGQKTFEFTDRYGDIGILVKKGGSLFIDPPKASDQEKKETSTSYVVQDYIQTVLDWAGLVPFYGDAIDIGNALWYAGRGKYFDAVLSSIAVIPAAGSVFKLGFKNTFKVFAKNLGLANKVSKRILAGTPGAAREFWELAFKDFKSEISKDKLDLLAKGAEDVANSLAAAEKNINKFSILKTTQNANFLNSLRKFFDDTASVLSKTQIDSIKGLTFIKPFAKAFDAAKTSDQVGKTALGAFSSVIRVIKNYTPIIGKKARISKLFRITPKNIDELAAGYKNFVRMRIEKNPDFLAAIARAMPKPKLQEIFGTMNWRGIKVSPSTVRRPDFWNDPVFMQKLRNSDKMDAFFNAAEKDNPIYNMFMNNKAWQSEQYFKRASDFKNLLQQKRIKEAMKSIISEYTDLKKLLFSRKAMDQWKGEYDDLMGSLGISDDRFGNNPDAVILPFAFILADIFSGESIGTTRMSMSTKDSPFIKFVNGLNSFVPYLNWGIINQMKLYDPDNPDAFTQNFQFNAGYLPGMTADQKLKFIDKAFNQMGLGNNTDFDPIKEKMKAQVMTWADSPRNPENQIQNQPSDRL